MAHSEAVIDFGDDDREEDVNESVLHALSPRIAALRAQLQAHVRTSGRGEMVREGVSIALVGPPNAGNS